MFGFVKYLKNYKKQVIIGPFFKLLEAVFEIMVPLVMSSIIDVGIKNQNTAYVLKMGCVMVTLGVSGYVFALICQYSAAIASQGFGTILRQELFHHINKLSYKELDQVGSNSLITRITNDVNQMQVAIAMLIRLVIRAPFLIIGSAIMAMILDLKLSLIFLFVTPLVVVVLYLVMSKSIPFYKIRQEKLDRVSLITRENLEGARVIRAFSKQANEQKRFKEAGQEVTDIAIRVGKISAVLNPATFTILNFAIIAIIWFGGYRVFEGSLTQGQIIAFSSYMTQISLALVVVANLVVIFTKASASAARINEILNMNPSIEEGKRTEVVEKRNLPQISFRNVSFSYTNSDKYSLENVSIDINRGETIGIIGGTGSGKSTFIHLLPRFYDVTKGEIKLQGIPLKEYSLTALRSEFGIVPQRAVLFKETIRKNMQWRKADATDEEIWVALAFAQADEFVGKLPEGLDTVISQGGKNFSGGQRQRLTIARALVGKPHVLILDDSSSALDYATDAKLRAAIKSLSDHLTVFLVSQRANSIKHANKIIVLEDGKVVGIGTHSILFETCEVYREIALSQLSKEEALA